MELKKYECCIIGAGPAGLSAALELVKHGKKNIIIVDKNHLVGGLARTEERDGVRFDVGPHRFFTHNKEVNNLWKELLGKDFIPVSRLTRIYYKGKYFLYPIKATDAFFKMGLLEAAHAFFSFMATKFNKQKEAHTFEEWITQKFGKKLYNTFFKTYTEKVWGIPCNEIGAEWASQRIKGLDIIEVIKKAFSFGDKNGPKSLVEQFDYPIYGAGQMYEKMAEIVKKAGGEIYLTTKVNRFNRNGSHIESIEVEDQSGKVFHVKADHYFNSAPLTHFYKLLKPTLGNDVDVAVNALYYREHITVDLLVKGDNLFPDQWIYVHSPDVKMARLANYNNFSKAMVGQAGKSAISVEYFTFQHEDLWKMKDDDLIKLAIKELEFTGLIPKESFEKGWVVRETESYPTYYMGYKGHYELLQKEANAFDNLSPIGRGGLYKYNNQDHSIYSGLLAARNYLKLNKTPYDIWSVNIDSEYIEK